MVLPLQGVECGRWPAEILPREEPQRAIEGAALCSGRGEGGHVDY